MRAFTLTAALLLATAAHAETFTLEPTTLTEWKSVYGRVEARDTTVARARIGGTLTELTVSEGDLVETGDTIGLVHDDKIAFQIAAVDAQLEALAAQLERAESELARGQALVERGTLTSQAFERLVTDVEVTKGQIAAAESQRQVIQQQGAEGAVLAPAAGRILTVPVTKNSVVMPGEPVATIGSNGFFLRIAVPERHAGKLSEGAAIQINAGGTDMTGTLAKVYPLIENGRVIADVEVEGLDTEFVDARVLVEVPVGDREVLMIPESAVETRSGIDFVTVEAPEGELLQAVVLGRRTEADGTAMVEVLTGLVPGDEVLIP